MAQSYDAIASCICIPLHFPLFNPALTLYCATGAYLRHTVVGGTPQLRKCRVVTFRHATSWLSVWRSARPPPEAETMTGGEHFRHLGGGGSRA